MEAELQQLFSDCTTFEEEIPHHSLLQLGQLFPQEHHFKLCLRVLRALAFSLGGFGEITGQALRHLHHRLTVHDRLARHRLG